MFAGAGFYDIQTTAWSLLIQVMGWDLLSIKPVPETLMTYRQPNLYDILIEIQKPCFNKMYVRREQM